MLRTYATWTQKEYEVWQYKIMHNVTSVPTNMQLKLEKSRWDHPRYASPSLVKLKENRITFPFNLCTWNVQWWPWFPAMCEISWQLEDECRKCGWTTFNVTTVWEWSSQYDTWISAEEDCHCHKYRHPAPYSWPWGTMCAISDRSASYCARTDMFPSQRCIPSGQTILSHGSGCWVSSL